MNRKCILAVVRPIRKTMERRIVECDEQVMLRKGRIRAIGQCDLYATEVTLALVLAGIQATTVVGHFYDDLNKKCAIHFWTECNKWIVDITVDQFGQYLPGVLVGRYEDYPQYHKDETATKEWHTKFSDES